MKRSKRLPMGKKRVAALSLCALFIAGYAFLQASQTTVGNGRAPAVSHTPSYSGEGNNFTHITGSITASVSRLPRLPGLDWFTSDRTEAPKVPQVTGIAGFADGAGVRTLPRVVHAPDDARQRYYQDVGEDAFEKIRDNTVKLVSEEPVSTFSIDVDTASYAFVRRPTDTRVVVNDRPYIDEVQPIA